MRLKFTPPDFSNMTPEGLADELGRLSIIRSWEKKQTGFHKEAFHARRQSPLVKGDKFICSVSEVTQTRFDTESFKRDHPELYAKYLKTSSFSRIDIEGQPTEPEIKSLLEQLRMELDLDD